ncbi:outer membrane protein assembly factor BamD [bacterium]|nr:outer membrane protein assembly factor BamD [bacterium]
MSKHFFALGILVLVAWVSGCKTKGEIRREQEMERLKVEVKEAKDIRADVDTTVEELKMEVARLTSVNEEQAAIHRNLSEELKNEVLVLQQRIQALEQRAVAQELALKQPSPKEAPTATASYEQGKKLYDEGKFDEALEVLREVEKKNPKNSELAKKTQFLIGEVLFSAKDYASAALEFAEFRKEHPKDSLVPTAIYRQAWAFKNLGKNKEARLFFQDLIERYPSHSMGQRAKNDVKKLAP